MFNCFDRGTAIWLFFKRTLILTIFMAISGETIMANITKMAIMAIMGLSYIVTNMANIGAISKNSKNADPRSKLFF